MSDLLTVTRDIEAPPPPHWHYTVPETGVTFTANWARDLKAKVRAHLEANGLPVPADEILNDAICRSSGLGSPYCGKLRRTQRPEGEIVGLNFAHVASFLRAVRHYLTDRRFVAPEEAQRRVAICLACPLATDVGDCATCFGVSRILKYASQFIGKFGIEMPKEKRTCAACGCQISVKALLPIDILRKVDEKKPEQPAYHENCWMREP